MPASLLRNVFRSLSFRLGFVLSLMFTAGILGFVALYFSWREMTAGNVPALDGFGIFALILFLAVFAAAALYVIFAVGRPLSELAVATSRIARGDYSRLIRPRGNDEIGELARAFNSMVEKARERTAQLEKSRDEFQGLFERVPCYITVQDKDLRLIRYNREFDHAFGPVTDEYCYQAYKQRSAPCENCMVKLTMQDGRIHSSEELGLTRDGQKRSFLITTAPIRDEHGRISAVMEMSTDITALRRLQTELTRSEEKYRVIFNNVPHAIFVLDPRTLEILDINDRAVTGYGFSGDQLRSMNFTDLSPEEERAVVALGVTTCGVVTNLRQFNSGGDTIYVNVRVSPSQYGDKKVLIATTVDVTDQMETEQQLIQAAKMATLGEMSTGMAHELNQPLSVIKTAASIILRRLAQGKETGDALLGELNTEIDAQVDRASRIINHMREFGRKPEIHKQRVNLNDALRDSFTVFGQQLKLRQIEVIMNLDDDLPPVLADKNRLEQVFVNLALNARDAIEERKARLGGDSGGNRITINSFRDGDRVAVTLADTGMGIPKRLKGKVFEPFFTTKEQGKGTGLGLSISYGIVRDYGGSIDFQSEEGKGTVFTIHFPMAKES